MRCERFREAASARLDGEPMGVPSAQLDEHLDTCAGCAAWFDDATRLTRLVRMQSAPPPDLSERLVADVARPAGRVLRRRTLLRVALLLVALAQIGISVPPLLGDSVGMAMSMHGMHETAAWNLALGVAFAATALSPRRTAGLLPVLLGFVVVLGVLSVHDEIDGAVTADRLLTHVAVLAGLVVVWALGRVERTLPTRERPSVPVAVDGPEDRLRGVA